MSLPKTTLAMVQTGKRQLEKRSLPIPDINAETALLEIEACGICGSDYEQFEGVLGTPIPAIPGHEPLGKIVAIGDVAAKRWGVDIGDRVAVETMLPCHHCLECHSGRYHICGSRQIYSYISLNESHGLWGAYAQYMVLDKNSIVHKMRADIPAEIAVMFNPLGAGFRWAVEIPETKVGDTVVIMGPGQRGLSSVIACKMAGAAKIIVTGLEQDEQKLRLAKFYGADHTIDVTNENAAKKIPEYTQGKGADIVVDVSSYATKPVTDALQFVKQGGTVVLAGMKGFKSIPDFISDIIVVKEITLKGAIGVTSSGYKNAIRAIESGNIDFSIMHTHNFKLEEAELAIKTLAREIPNQESIHSCLIPEH
jgi:threonine dehydrogenase-like Zn-dependent dehydrogenase